MQNIDISKEIGTKIWGRHHAYIWSSFIGESCSFLWRKRYVHSRIRWIYTSCSQISITTYVWNTTTSVSIQFTKRSRISWSVNSSLLLSPGFIAGVTNPIIKQHTSWYDLCCEIETGLTIPCKPEEYKKQKYYQDDREFIENVYYYYK